MGENTFRYRPGGWRGRPEDNARPPAWVRGQADDSSGTYWRRRFMILIIGLSVFAMAAWTLSDALQVSPGKSASGDSGSGQPGHGLVPGGGSPGGGSPGGGSAGISSPGGAASARSASPGAASLRPGPSPTPSAGAHRFRGFQPAFCARSSIVLSLAATAVTFGPRQLPGFSLSVVSTQPGSCSFNVGPRHLALVIREGPARIWSSADCVSGAGSLVSALRRGVPTIVAISWNRQTSAPGCASPARLAPPGTYTGYAVDGSLVSAPVPIRLR